MLYRVNPYRYTYTVINGLIARFSGIRIEDNTVGRRPNPDVKEGGSQLKVLLVFFLVFVVKSLN